MLNQRKTQNKLAAASGFSTENFPLKNKFSSMRNTKIMLCTSLIGLLLVFAASCKYDEILPEPVEPIEPGVSFAEDLIPIFNEGCNTSGCHGVNEFDPDLSPANAYDALFEGGYIDTIMPENSLLYRWMRGDEGAPMPINGTNPTYNATVLAWIQEGALNN
jgi:hypothetical protein